MQRRCAPQLALRHVSAWLHGCDGRQGSCRSAQGIDRRSLELDAFAARRWHASAGTRPAGHSAAGKTERLHGLHPRCVHAFNTDQVGGSGSGRHRGASANRNQARTVSQDEAEGRQSPGRKYLRRAADSAGGRPPDLCAESFWRILAIPLRRVSGTVWREYRRERYRFRNRQPARPGARPHRTHLAKYQSQLRAHHPPGGSGCGEVSQLSDVRRAPGRWREETINVNPEDLKGNVRCYPDTDENFPESWVAQRAVWTQLMAAAAQNPILQAILAVPRNLAIAKDKTGLPELVVPAAEAASKQAAEIMILMDTPPSPNPQLEQAKQAFGA